ncbi:3-oxoadipate enol-lactonase [Streptomyces sp. HNM0574]|uniref:3-oxoadipate enol-lactonase n=1 Tax=Streptomyces sp. HNM0574 TaxID=2714954 RepID=UPI001469F353|nr:3-oxoadipate enol-lactonase [Streptomyces sp. HNM0574]
MPPAASAAGPAPLLQHRLDGPADGVPLVLGPSLGTSLRLWEPQLAALTREHRVLRWDLPGHGGSPAHLLPQDGTAEVGTLAGLVLRLADAQGWDRFAYAGVSLGGAVGLELADRHPERLTALAVVCSSARFGDPDTWRGRARKVREEGTESMVSSRPGVWYGQDFSRSAAAAELLADLRAADDAGYAACCDALAAFDLRERLPYLAVPVLAVAGREDPATPPAHAREIADRVPGAALVEVPGAAHLANAEHPEPVTASLLTHLAAHARASPRR